MIIDINLLALLPSCREGNDGRGISNLDAQNLELHKQEGEQTQEDIEKSFEIKGREIRHMEISDAYQTAQDMLTNFNSYMDKDEKGLWFNIIAGKALILTGQHDESIQHFICPHR